MSAIIGFILGFGVGATITFFTIILFAKTMDKEHKKIYTETAREKWKK